MSTKVRNSTAKRIHQSTCDTLCQKVLVFATVSVDGIGPAYSWRLLTWGEAKRVTDEFSGGYYLTSQDMVECECVIVHHKRSGAKMVVCLPTIG